MADLTGQTTRIRASRVVVKRQLGDQGSVPQSAGSDKSIGPFPVEPSTYLSTLPKGPGGHVR